MTSSGDFHSQIASIMEVLANAAVAEICKVVDDGYAVVHLEMSRSQKENDFLRRKIKLLELQIARYRAERVRGPEGSTGSRFPGVRLLNRQSRDSPAGPSLQTRTRFLNRGSGSQQPVQKTPLIDLDQDPDQEVVTTTKTEAQGCLINTSSPHSQKENVEEVKGDPPGRSSPLQNQNQLEWQQNMEAEDPERPSCSTYKPENSSFSHSLAFSFHSVSKMSKSGMNQDSPASSFDSTAVGSVSHVAEDKCSKSWTSGGGDGADEVTQYQPLLLLHQGGGADGIPVATGMVDSQQSQPFCSGVQQTDNFSNQLYQPSSSLKPESGPSQPPPSLPYGCTFCSRRYAHRCQLRSHERVHTGEKPYQCTQCGKRFGQICSLKRHQMVHTGERPFPCPHCGKQFSTSTNLKVHQSVHTGEKRFLCSKCGKNYSFLSNLIRHQALHSAK
uniref:C2H2-type domain-containing protein n=1 Tax=Acanthochromis polyacanthus TaxID=80966 RepID=A0A3Q1HBJ8_9TELE